MTEEEGRVDFRSVLTHTVDRIFDTEIKKLICERNPSGEVIDLVSLWKTVE